MDARTMRVDNGSRDQAGIETNWNPTGYSFQLTDANWKNGKQEKKRQLKLIEVNLYVK